MSIPVIPMSAQEVLMKLKGFIEWRMSLDVQHKLQLDRTTRAYEDTVCSIAAYDIILDEIERIGELL